MANRMWTSDSPDASDEELPGTWTVSLFSLGEAHGQHWARAGRRAAGESAATTTTTSLELAATASSQVDVQLTHRWQASPEPVAPGAPLRRGNFVTREEHALKRSIRSVPSSPPRPWRMPALPPPNAVGETPASKARRLEDDALQRSEARKVSRRLQIEPESHPRGRRALHFPDT